MIEQPMPWRMVFQGERGKLTAGVLLVEFLVAVEALVVVAIMPAVRKELGGLQYYGLVFTGFSLAALVGTPLGGRAGDRRSPAVPFMIAMAAFIVGTALCGLAVSMPTLVLARLLQGAGAGAGYTVSLTAITRSYPSAAQARVLALLAGAWIVPGLLGPSYGALLASSIGWRWAFFSIIPLIVLAVALTLPGLRRLQAAGTMSSHVAWRWPLQLAVGLSALAIGASFPSLLTVPLILLGAGLSASALLAILPSGSLTARPGMPSAIAVIFLLIFAFIGTEYFLPLMVTAIRGRSLNEAGVLVTLGTVSWSLGNWWQSRAVTQRSPVMLARLGTAILIVAIVAVLLMLTNAPLLLSYAGWFLAGIGMGVAYPTAYLVIMRNANAGSEGVAVSAQQVAERLALAVGGAVGGGCIALALALHASLKAGLAGAFSLTLIAALLALGLAPRLTSASETRSPSTAPTNPTIPGAS